MANKNRDEFTPRTRRQIAKRAGWLCSDPSCRRLTVSSNSTGDGEIDLGTAAHICAAAPDGPRYESNQTREQRRAVENGIWMCRIHGATVDTDEKYTVELLQQWRVDAYLDAWRRNVHNDLATNPSVSGRTEEVFADRIRAAVSRDLQVFRHSDKWPPTNIQLTLEVPGVGDAVSTSALATALRTLDDMILVAPPGMGKTTTLLQIAESTLADGQAVPIVIPLGDWSTTGLLLLESVLKRPAFRGFGENDFREAAASAGLILLLDGWNELDSSARKRAAADLARLQAELPELGILVSTRRQALDVPINGTRVNLLPLNQTQQLDIARALRGDAGGRILDRARRTEGVRELVAIPLYLSALLALPEDEPFFPTTKEAVLRHFVNAHEKKPLAREALEEVAHGLHQRFLEDLATTATFARNTTITESTARKSVSETDETLVLEGQITEKPQPNNVLNVLVSHHVLVRIGDPPGYSFQHHQFLEWYASHFAARLMLSSVHDAIVRRRLQIEVLDVPVWEEAILFAAERLAGGGQKQQEACGIAILAAFDVDPILAAEMIFRSTDAVWARVSSPIQALIARWHSTGRIDRALGFMITSGRPEFLEKVWPLITHADSQVHLSALRTGRQFRPSLLGNEAPRRIATLPADVRKHVLSEIASNSGIDGMDLAMAITMDDSDVTVKVAVLESLAFRGADRHVAEILRFADERTFDLVSQHELAGETSDEQVAAGLQAARERQQKNGLSSYARLRAILTAPDDADLNDELIAAIADMAVEKQGDAAVHLLYEARSRHSPAIAEGILRRVRVNNPLFYGADDFLASMGLSFEDDELLEIALAETERHDGRAEAAASVLGPEALGCMIKAAFQAKQRVRDSAGRYDQSAADRYHALCDRIAHAPGGSLVGAAQSLSAQAGNGEMAELAELISRHANSDENRSRPYGRDALATLRTLVQDWGERMLMSGDATRWELASIAAVASRAPSIELLPLLKRLLDDNLSRYRAFREEATRSGWKQGRVTEEARTPNTHQYQRAFDAIPSPETAELMREYLHDEYFGEQAAQVLAAQWIAVNEPSDGKRRPGQRDFSRIRERRAARCANAAGTCVEAEAIFSVIDSLIGDEATEARKKHAVALSIVAARLPHGKRESTFQKLIWLASRRSRAALVRNLVLSGNAVNVEILRQSIQEVFDAAKTQPWILSENSSELSEWLCLLPFADPATETFSILRELPDDYGQPDRLEEVIGVLGAAPSDASENTLFRLGETDSRFYSQRAWREAIMRQGTLSAAHRFIALAADDAFEGSPSDRWYLARQIGGLMDAYPQARAQVYELLRSRLRFPAQDLFIRAVEEHPDEEGLLLLIDVEVQQGQRFISPRAIENVVTKHVPHEEWKGSYNIVPVAVIELRRKLLAMTTDGGPKDFAARILTCIDTLRDRYGVPDDEPRHPNIDLGKAWPIMTADPDSEAPVQG